MRLAIDASSFLARCAAPAAPSIGLRESAGNLSLRLWVGLEFVASAALPPDTSFAALARRDFARVCIAFGVSQSQRLIEVLRTSAQPHPDPTIIHGLCECAKDGDPMWLYAPAVGITGPFLWYPSLLASLLGRKHVLRGVKAPGGDVALATAFSGGAMKAPSANVSFRSLCVSIVGADNYDAMAIHPHCMHGHAADVAAYIGSFDSTEIDVLGHWRRKKREGPEAAAAAAAAASEAASAHRAGDTSSDPRKAAAIAQLTAAPDKSKTMGVRYVSGQNHEGECERQLLTRFKLISHVARCVRSAPSSTAQWPTNRADWSLLKSEPR